MRPNTLYAALALVLLMIVFSARAEPFKVPPMGAKESGTLVVNYKDSGKKWSADWIAEKFSENGQNYIRITFTGNGLLHPFSENVTWVSESVFSADGSFIPVSTLSTVKNMKGDVVQVEKKSIDLANSEATFERKGTAQEDSLNETFDFTPETLIVEGVFMALRTLSFENEEEIKAGFLSNEPELYKVEFKQKGIEKVQTDEGEVECYKVELVPKLGVIGVLKVFFPKTYFWFTVAPPHRWVKYVGYENGRNSPEVVMNVLNFKSSD